MSNKLVVVTGVTSGIGREVAFQVAAQGASLVLLARDTARADAVASEIAAQTGKERPLVFACDQSRADSVRACGTAVRARFDRIDVLVNNAGARFVTRKEAPDGVELVFATNVLGYHHLTQELLPLLERAPSARIVNTASVYAGGLDFDDLEFKRRAFDDVKSYKQSKQANRLWSWALARRVQDKKITVNAMSPGFISTGLFREQSGFNKAMTGLLIKAFGESVAKGADTLTWLALSPDVEGRTGLFWVHRKETACKFRNEKDEEALWSVCEDYAARRKPSAAA
jgi:NAD(P)-dependent dehydrogenase (short-subunit alcohol dehydrogenase family)